MKRTGKMLKLTRWIIAASALVAFMESPFVFAVTVTESTRMVQSSNFIVTWSNDDQEAILGLQWDSGGNPASASNVTASSNVGRCPAPFAPEYWGNSWARGAPETGERVLVGLGTITPPGETAWAPAFEGVEIHSQSTDCPPPFVAAEVPVRTRYLFFDDGPRVNVIKVDREFDFQDQPLNSTFRPYMPRLSRGAGLRFDEVRYPTTGSALAVVSVTLCPFGCTRPDWDPAHGWFAIHSPTTGKGVIVKRTPNGITPQLFVDWDGASFTNASSFLLLPPPGGFGAQVTERMALCFYDSTIWPQAAQQALTLPAGCLVNEPPVADAGPDQSVSAGEGCQTSVTLDGTGSSDPDHDTLTYTWTGSFGTAEGVTPTITLPAGTHDITLTVSDGQGGSTSDTVVVVVRDTTSPVLTNVPTPITLEQAGPTGAPFTLPMPTVTDNCASFTLTSDAPAIFPPGTTIVTFTASDTAGNTATASTTVTVVCCRIGLTVNKPSARRGEFVMITGFVHNFSNVSQNVTLQFELTSPIKNKMGAFSLTLPAETNKSHRVPFKLPANAQLGTYTLKLTTVTGAGALETVTTFQVLP